MANKTALKRVASTVTGLGAAVSSTFAEKAHEITSAAREAFGKMNWEIPKDELQFIVDAVRDEAPWKGTSSEAARLSETKAIVTAYPFLGAAARIFKDSRGELRREHLVKVARECPSSPDAESAAAYALEYFESRDKKRGNGKGLSPAEKVANGLKQAIVNSTDAGLKRSLYTLCKKHSIKVS